MKVSLRDYMWLLLAIGWWLDRTILARKALLADEWKGIAETLQWHAESIGYEVGIYPGIHGLSISISGPAMPRPTAKED